ncbi:MAG TPA: A24 family peptidase [Candidatus Saccharimonadales bacterium]|jgi:prepilin peptidase CpaA|nr:A24 family peptidase [Candidatus Saccharimonadales bacterium]
MKRAAFAKWRPPPFSSVERGADRKIDALLAIEDLVLVLFVVTIIVTDWRWRRIPNAVTYPTMLLGLALGAIESAGPAGFPGSVFPAAMHGGILDHVVGLAVGFLVAYPFYAGGGLKAGDGKFLMAVGALLGTLFLLQAAVWGALVGGVIAIGFIVARRVAAARAGTGETVGGLLHTWIPYGVALGLGALVALAIQLNQLRGIS